jgi:hypothetical protein
MFQKKGCIYILVMLLMTVYLNGLQSRKIVGGLSMELNSNPIPSLKSGDSWCIETHLIEDLPRIAHRGEELKDIVFYHRYEVVGEEIIRDNKAWVIDIKPVDVPSDVPNDHGDSYLWRLYISQEDFTLVRLESSVRSLMFLVSGDSVESRTLEFQNGEPAVLNSISLRTPIDIPKFPVGKFPRMLMDKEVEYRFLNEDTSSDCMQRLEVVERKINGTRTSVLYVTLYGPVIGYRTQIWVPGLPWWKEWSRISNDGEHRGLWYAKMVDWSGGKKD